jgi:hypothetical protein
MRTKVLALSALVGALGAASAIAQTNVYSINAVGYINVTVQPGFNIIADQLISSNSVNTIGTVLNNTSLTGGPLSGNPGPYEGCTVYKYSNALKGYTSDNADASFSSYANGWDANGTITMNPGEAIWFENNETTNITLTFVGTVPQGTNTVTLPFGFNMASSPVPFSGDLVTNAQMTNYNYADTMYEWGNNGHHGGSYSQFQVDVQFGSVGYNGQWDSPGDLTAAVGQGFWYQNNGGNPSGPGPNTTVVWTQVFSINP